MASPSTPTRILVISFDDQYSIARDGPFEMVRKPRLALGKQFLDFGWPDVMVLQSFLW